MAITTDRLLRGVKRRVTIVANNQLLQDSDLLELADDVMRDRMVPLIKSLDGNYMLAEPTQENLTADEDHYDIPYRAVGRKLRNVKLSPTGTGQDISDLTLLDDDKVQTYAVSGVPFGFYYVGDQLVVRPKPSETTGYLELWWYLQPSLLVQTTAVAQLTAAPAAGVCQVSSIPSTMTTGTVCDLIQARSGNRVYALDVAITATGANTISFDPADIDAAFTTGDWIALSQQTPVLQIPDEAYPLLETAICERVLYAIGDFDGAAKLMDKDIPMQERELKRLLEPRTDEAPIKLVNRNGLLRRRQAWPRRGLYF